MLQRGKLAVGLCRSSENVGPVTKRPRATVTNLLALPPDTLKLIAPFLGTKSLAAARLACCTLRNAFTGDKIVTFTCDGWYSAKISLSPGVLKILHAYSASLARLEEAKQEESRASVLIPPFFRDERFRRWMQSEALANVSRDVYKLRVGAMLCLQAPAQLHAALSNMRRLTSLIVDGTLDICSAVELGDKRNLSILEVAALPAQGVVQRLCNLAALTRLDLGRDQATDVAWTLGLVPEEARGIDYYLLIIQACGFAAQLRGLSLPCPAAGVQHLSTLSRLTRLHLRMWDAPASLSQWSGLSALESISFEVQDWAYQFTTRFESLSPLTALSRLTSLVLQSRTPCEGHWVCQSRSEMSVLSRLAALRVFHYENIVEASLVGEEAVPVQLRVLASATALEALQLGFSAAFWESLPDASCRAVHVAVCGLQNLKTVRLLLWGEEDMGMYYTPLVAFTGAPGIRLLRYECKYALPWDMAGQAPSCLTALTELKELSLTIPSCPNGGDLLAGLPSRHLTSLRLHCQDMTLALTQEVAQFLDVQELEICSWGSIASKSLDPLFCMTGLTSLEIMHPSRRIEQGCMRSMFVSDLPAQAARLKAAILESAVKFGVAARVHFGEIFEHAEADSW